MRIGYRRAAGMIGLTAAEGGTRGTWAEKRRAVLQTLRNAGHKVTLMSPVTDPTAAAGAKCNPFARVEVLFVEFAGTNLAFHGKGWQETCRIIGQHEGKVVFLCDDPDLPFLWSLLPHEDWRRWVIAANASECAEVRRVLKVPDDAEVIDWPMAAGMPAHEFADGSTERAVYIGRNNGRAESLKNLLSGGRVVVAGKPSEWNGWDVPLLEIPQQRDRAAIYQNYRACLAAYDRKHAVTGWRTGRAYHSVFAGTPVLAPTGNPGLRWTQPVTGSSDIERWVTAPRAERLELWTAQMTAVRAETADLAIGRIGL